MSEQRTIHVEVKCEACGRVQPVVGPGLTPESAAAYLREIGRECDHAPILGGIAPAILIREVSS